MANAVNHDFFPGVVGCSKENFDSYFTKLQNICTDNMNEDVKSNSAAAAAAAGLDGGKGQQVQQGDLSNTLCEIYMTKITDIIKLQTLFDKLGDT